MINISQEMLAEGGVCVSRIRKLLRPRGLTERAIEKESLTRRQEGNLDAIFLNRPSSKQIGALLRKDSARFQGLSPPAVDLVLSFRQKREHPSAVLLLRGFA